MTLPVASSKKRALVLGVNGQDGSYLAQHLIKTGCEVHGISRQCVSRWLDADSSFVYHCIDLTDVDALWKLLDEIRPDAIFHFAAVHGPAGFSYETHWRDVHAVNVVTVHALLEYQRSLKSEATLIYASSSKVFGEKLPSLITEYSPRYSTCIYTTTKNAATDLILYYRKQHKSKSSVIWTFNHESPRRGSNFFLPKIVDVLAKAIMDRSHTADITSLAFWGDWGDANEFMQLVATMPAGAPDNDVILATGKTIWAEEFVSALFAQFGLDWRVHLREKFTLREEGPERWKVEITKLGRLCGAVPVRTAFDVALDILKQKHPAAWGKAGIPR